MNKTQNTNVTMQTEEFDRSICMTFFGNYRTSVKRIEKKYGKETAYDVQSAIIDYGLYGIKPTDEDLLIFISETVFDVIDKGQEKRARAFSGEDLEMSKKIIQSHRDRPDLSQDKLAELLHTSKGKVNKTLKKYRNGEYEGILTFDDDNVSDNDNGNDGDYDSTDRDRDRPTVQSSETASPITEATLPTPPPPTPTELTWEEEVTVIKAFQKRQKPIEISKELSLDFGLVNLAIDEYKDRGYKLPPKPEEVKTLDVPLMNGGYHSQTKEELFNDATDNGKSDIDDVAWDGLRSGYIMYGISPILTEKLIEEFQARLLKKYKRTS
jgi:hypothetical protein